MLGIFLMLLPLYLVFFNVVAPVPSDYSILSTRKNLNEIMANLSSSFWLMIGTVFTLDTRVRRQHSESEAVFNF